MRNFIVTIMFFLAFSNLMAQSDLPKGNRLPGYQDWYTSFGAGVSSWGVPFYGRVETMIFKEISVGGEFSFRRQSNSFQGITFYNTSYVIAGRGSYHFNKLLKLRAPYHVYGGVALGFTVLSVEDVNDITYTGPRNSGPYFSLHAGGSYYFNRNWALNSELIAGTISGVRLGMTYLF